ncbi:uncharacterized protein LOC119097144 isoform X2 [Pollicipes pollicipes]|nr:uncharacterized protein LOC119097144 isoform X2 [Pollicipes pollicipes]XP_037076099.1 uncharacterized protein LOC119097144 isoform X2 [Pollicipes pollicipes]XP_037076100.1 uncharacterized protein LOC119097144 isoform X2 [Pollicipes pollicipes]
MTSQPSSSRQQLLEEVLQTKELLQSKQKHKNSGGWTMTTAEVLNSADRAEVQVQMEAYRKQLQLRQRKMSAALKAQTMQLPLSKTLSDASCELSHGHRQELEQRLHTLESSIRQSELSARETVTQIRSRRQRQLRAIQDLGIPAASVASAPSSSGLSTPSTPPPGPGSGWEEAAPVRRPRSLHSPSLVRRRTPLRFISALSRTKRRSGADWEEPVAERPAEAPPLRSQVSAEALREIARFERLMETFLRLRHAGHTHLLTVEHYL